MLFIGEPARQGRARIARGDLDAQREAVALGFAILAGFTIVRGARDPLLRGLVPFGEGILGDVC